MLGHFYPTHIQTQEQATSQPQQCLLSSGNICAVPQVNYILTN